MKVNKHGDLLKKRTHKFKCYNCGCKYTAKTGEWGYCDEYKNPKTNPTDYVSCQCPECGKLNHIQWRGNVRDWWGNVRDWGHDNYATMVLIITLLAFLSMIVFRILNMDVLCLASIFVFVIGLLIIRFLLD